MLDYPVRNARRTSNPATRLTVVVIALLDWCERSPRNLRELHSSLSVDENVLSSVRRHAAERNSSVNALVREFLAGLAAHQDRAKRARARLRQLSEQTNARVGKKT